MEDLSEISSWVEDGELQRVRSLRRCSVSIYSNYKNCRLRPLSVLINQVLDSGCNNLGLHASMPTLQNLDKLVRDTWARTQLPSSAPLSRTDGHEGPVEARVETHHLLFLTLNVHSKSHARYDPSVIKDNMGPFFSYIRQPTLSA